MRRLRGAAVLAVLALASAGQARAGDCYVTWNCGGSAQCAQAYGSATGSNGPFDSCADFVQRDAVSKCSCGGGSAAATGVPAAGGGYTPQQQAVLNGAQLLMPVLQQGVHDAIYGNPEKEAAQRAQDERDAEDRERQKEQDDRALDESKDRLLGDMVGVDTAAATGDEPLRLMDASDEPPPGRQGAPKPKQDDLKAKPEAFVKGYRAAAGCGSQNAGPACAGVTADQQDQCVADYRRGFDVGRKQAKNSLDSAYRKGLGAGLSGLQNNAASDPDSNGDCRTEWIEAYNRGHFEGSHPPAKN